MLDELTLKDLKLVYEIPHHDSLQSLARALRIEPQNVSKIIKRIENQIGLTLIVRSNKGSIPTSDALQLAEVAKKILNTALEFSMTQKKGSKKVKEYTVTARVFMNACLSGELALASENELSDVRFKFIDASPRKKEEWARKGLIDLVISIEEIDLGKSWHSEKVGDLTWSFYGRKNHPIGTYASLGQILNYPLLIHSHIQGERMVDSKIISLLKLAPNKFGHSTENAITSVKIISKTDQIGFLPDLIFNQNLFKDQIQKISTEQANTVSQPIYISAHVDRVSKIHYSRIKLIVSKAL